MTPPSSTPEMRNTYALAGRVALITGATGGLGASIAQAFKDAQAHVIEVGSAARSQVADPQATVERVDVMDEAAVEALFGRVVAAHGRVDIVVNTVGGFHAGEPVDQLATAVWQQMLDLNVRSTFLVSKYAAQVMRARQYGRIINVASRSAFTGRKHAAAYAVAKRAVITLTEAQAEELRDERVTVNAVVPSIIDTPANRAGMPNADVSRWPKPEEIARVIVFLATDDASLINGAAIPVYGLA